MMHCRLLNSQDDLKQIGETWAVGYTPHLVTGVWFGNSDNTPMVNILSTSVSWRAYRDFMDFAHEHLNLPPDRFVRPPTVVERELCWPSGRLPTDACPNMRRYKGLFAQETLDHADEDNDERGMFDTWWQRSGGGVTLVLPEDEIRDWPGLWDWAGRNGL